ncbi:MAG: type I secretion system permease/ATPase [Rhodobacteraceae bacterium]|nr:type I secretion system permease/ATPase [Paracoccaceae bacterium]
MAASLRLGLSQIGVEVGADTLLAGLPLPPDGRLTPALAVRALDQIGVRARITRRQVKDIPPALLPAVVLLTGRDAAVLLRLDTDGALLMWPARGDDPVHLSRAEFTEAYDGHLILMRPDLEEEATRDGAQGHWFWAPVRKAWPDYLQVILASALINLLALAVPIFTMNVYDRVFPTAALITLWSLVAGVGIALVFDAGLKILRAEVVDAVGRRVDARVSSTIFAHISDLRLDQAGPSTGALLNGLKDYETLRDVFSSQTVATLTDLAFAGLFIAVIAYLGGPLAWPPAIALTLVIVLGVALLRPLRQASVAARETGAARNAVAVEALSEPETLKAVAGQGRMQARWEQQVAQAAKAGEANRRLANWATTLTALAQQASSIAIVITGVYLALDGRITMGAVIAAMILSGRAMAPTAALAGLFVRASFALATLRSLTQVMEQPSDRITAAPALDTGLSGGALELQGAGLTYPDAQVAALRDVTLSLPPRGRLGVIGPVGAGKTSLVRMLAGLAAPTEGMVLGDGLNMAQIAPARLRRDIQYVPQEPVLFTGTLAENIAFGRPQATGADVLRVAQMVGVDRIAASHPQGFAMPIDEKGRNLSGGQRQLIALARALLPDPRVLILDEPSSSMDNASERMLVARLAQILRKRPMTLVISTHRTGLLALVDQLALIEGGRLSEFGPKADVLARLESRDNG